MSAVDSDDAIPRILYLTKIYPYPPSTAGDAVYSRGIIEALAVTCRLTVICATNGLVNLNAPLVDWRIGGKQRSGRVGSLLSRWPLIAWKGATSAFDAEFKKVLLQDWDCIVLDNLGLVHALPRALDYRKSHVKTKIIYISHEYEYPTRAAKYKSYRLSLPKKLLAQLDLAKVKSCEEALLRKSDIVTVINKSDLIPFCKIAPSQRYLPLLPGYNGPVVNEREVTIKTPRRVLLLGGRRSNQKQKILLNWLELAYTPLTADGIEMVVVGDMDDELRDFVVGKYPEVVVLGFVEDLGSLIASARLGLIADMVGGGFKMRLLSHVFERLPIVGLTHAIDGLPTAEGEGYLGAESLSALVDLVLAVIDDTERLNELHRKAFADCVDEYSWSNRAIAFTEALEIDRTHAAVRKKIDV